MWIRMCVCVCADSLEVHVHTASLSTRQRNTAKRHLNTGTQAPVEDRVMSYTPSGPHF